MPVKFALLALTLENVMKKKLLAALSAVLLASSVSADDAISANFTLATDYVWRGVSQTDENPAIQGGLDYSADNGFYIGTWGSNVDFGSVENLELDVYFGWATEFDNGLGLDIGFIQYLYFDNAGDVDFNEIYVGLSHSGFSGKVSFDNDNDATYVELGYDAELANDFGLGLHVGNYSFDGGFDYTDYSVSLSKSYGGLDFGLAYTDTDIDNVDAADARVVFSISKSF